VTNVLFTTSWYFLEDRNLLSFFLFNTRFLFGAADVSFFFCVLPLYYYYLVYLAILCTFSRVWFISYSLFFFFFVLFNLPTIILITTASWEYLYEKREGVLLLLLLLVRINSKLEYIYKREKWLKFCFYYYLLTCLNMIRRNQCCFF